MRFSFTTIGLALLACCAAPLIALAAPDPLEVARAQARQSLELANLELRLYQQVEYPRERRHLDAQIKLVEAEVDAYQEQFRVYRPFDRFSTGRPLLVSIQDLRLCLLEAELRLEDLRAERNALVRFHSDEWRLREIKVQQARFRVAELEGGGEITLETASASQPSVN